jgi:glycosyltransferase involved in cell wall biosynthesis
MMRRVLHVVPYLGGEAGGPPVVVKRLAEGARKAGWESRIVTSREFLSLEEERGLRTSEVMVLSSRRSALFGAQARALLAAIHQTDVLHCHTLWSPVVSRSAAIARMLGKKYVVAPHGMLDPYSFRQKNLKKRAYLECVERKTLSAASRILFTADDEMYLAERTLGNIPNAAVIPLGADRLPKGKSELRRKFFDLHPDLREKRILLFMGRLHPKKRPEVLLDVMAAIRSEIPDAVLLYAGGGDDKYVSEIKARSHKMGLAKCVRFLGHLSGEAKYSALASADLFLLPSHQENFAIALAEALHAGVPAIVTKRVNIWKEVVDANAGLAVDEGRLIENLTSAVHCLLHYTERRAGMSANAVSLASRAFTWDATCSLTLQLYEDILAEP